MELTALKAAVVKEIEAKGKLLSELSQRIHDNPELGLSEVKAASWLSDYLEQNGFNLERGSGGLATAFKASYGKGKPVVAFLAEYDALPGLGHACGHNIIAASAVGAGIAAKTAVDQLGGTIIVMGTPDEEKGGGKEVLIERGAFEGIDIALMIHPDVQDNAILKALACQGLTVEFFGKEAHAASSPETGINALEAMLLSFNAVNSLRQHLRSTARIHGIITDGGKAPNIVPAHSAASFQLRAEDDNYLGELKKRVTRCFEGAAVATGSRLEYRWQEVCYCAMKHNFTLAQLFQQNMESIERKVKISEEGTSFSTDMGNVSQIIPSLHAMVAIAPPEIKHHTPEFAEAAVSQAGVKGLLDGAKALAMTLADLLADRENVERAREEFLK